nr:NgoMIV family type II restriction endonuclease [Cellulosimicrobium sp. MM]
MPAPFAKDLCKYRKKNGKPNTSDASDELSVEVGEALFDVLGVSRLPTAGENDEPTGRVLADAVSADLSQRFPIDDGGIEVRPERKLFDFEQYRHVGAIRDVKPGRSKEFNVAWRKLTRYVRKQPIRPVDVRRVEEMIDAVESSVDAADAILRKLLDELGEESLLGLDLTVARQGTLDRLPRLEVGLSLKWSLRTDRAQDCRSQGAKMSALRRGRMPHFAVVTMEPRPYMLNLLGGGSGDVDCVYHLDLPALTAAVDDVYTTPARMRGRDQFHRLVDQRRIRDYDDLVAEIRALS